MYLPRIDAGVEMTIRDGVRLVGDLYRPADEGRWPTLLHRTPYDRTSPFLVSAIVTDPLWLARQGFAVLVQDTRGRAASGGEFDFVHQELDDSHDAVEWAAAQPWSTGEVGIYGSSYLGMVVLQAVAARSPHLKAAIAMAGTVDMRQTAHPGGVFESGFLTLYALGLALAGIEHAPLSADERERALKDLEAAFADRDATVAQLPLTDVAPLNDERLAPFWHDWLRHGPHDPFWDKPSLLSEPERVGIPFLQVSGYRDFLTPTQFELAGKLADNADARLVAGPWTHLGTYFANGQTGSRIPPGAPAGVPLWGSVIASFFDRHLRGGDGSDYPFAASFLDGTDPVVYYVGGEHRWRTAPAWPPAGETRDWTLASDGDARSAAGDGRLVPPGGDAAGAGSDTVVADPRDPFPTHGGPFLFEGDPAAHPEGIQDQRAVDGRSDVLVYTSAPLEADLTVVGRPELVVRLSSTAPDADLCVTLVDVEPGGFAANITEGAQRARYREGGDTDWLEPGVVVPVTVQLHDIAHTFPRGHRVRVQVAGASFPRFSRNLHTRTVPELGTLDEAVVAEHTLHHDGEVPTVLRLTVLP